LSDVARIAEFGSAQLGEIEVPERVEAMIHRNHGDIAAMTEPDSIGERRIRGSRSIAAAVKPIP